MYRLAMASLLAVVALPGLASAQFVGFSFGVRGGYGPYGYRGYYAPGVTLAYPYPAPSYVVVPAPVAVETVNSLKARITVLVPDQNAEIYIQDQRMNLIGRVREFFTQELQVGKKYSYTLTMQGHVDGHGVIETRKIEFQAGSRVVVDFTKPYVQPLPPPEYEPRHAVPDGAATQPK